MNNVRFYREQKGWTLKDLAQAANISVNYLQRLENYGWKQSQTGMETDERIAAALGIPLWKVFPEVYASPYPQPKKPEPQPKPDNRTPEEIDAELRLLNERRQAKIVGEREIYDAMAMDYCEEWCPGVVCGPCAPKHFQKEVK